MNYCANKGCQVPIQDGERLCERCADASRRKTEDRLSEQRKLELETDPDGPDAREPKEDHV